MPGLVWVSGSSAGLRFVKLCVQFLGRAHAWIVGQIPRWGVCEKQPIDVFLAHQCLSPSLSPLHSL